MPIISGDHPDTYGFTTTGKTYLFTSTFHGHDSDYYAIEENGARNTLIFHGFAESVSGHSTLDSDGENVTIRIAADGLLRGAGSALESSGVNARIVNEGQLIGAEGYGTVRLQGDEAIFRNRGSIACESDCIDVGGDGSVVINERGGYIVSTGVSSTIRMSGAFGEAITFINHGAVNTRNGFAIDGLSSDDKVRNTGTITGLINLGNGDDLVDNRGGVIRGDIKGGVGDDTLITDSNAIKLLESAGQGEDQVKSTVSYTLSENVEQLVLIGRKNIDGTGTAVGDRIYGNAGNNRLQGLDGIDTLRGMGGNDVLTGGNGADRFYFNRGYDRDTIDDFQQGSDRVYLEDWAALSTIEKVKSHASNHGQDVWISVGDDTLVIKGLHKADLTAGDFFFF